MNYIKIETEDVCNGDGLRVVLWLSGCSHHCYNCQNPQTWNPESGIPFDESAKEELFRELDKDYISGLTLTGGDPLHEANLGEVLEIVTEFNKKYKNQNLDSANPCKMGVSEVENSEKIRVLFPEKTIWLYSGFTWEQIFNDGAYVSKDAPGLKRRNIVKQCDVMVDGRYIDSQRNVSAKWRGSDNQRVISVQESLKQNKVILYCE